MILGSEFSVAGKTLVGTICVVCSLVGAQKAKRREDSITNSTLYWLRTFVESHVRFVA
jgi:hypothetical protein